MALHFVAWGGRNREAAKGAKEDAKKDEGEGFGVPRAWCSSVLRGVVRCGVTDGAPREVELATLFGNSREKILDSGVFCLLRSCANVSAMRTTCGGSTGGIATTQVTAEAVGRRDLLGDYSSSVRSIVART